MGSLGPFEIALIFLVILLVFGAKRIPEIARGLGKGIREFKSATKDISREFNVDESQNRIQPPAQGNPAPRADEYQRPAQQVLQDVPQQAPQQATEAPPAASEPDTTTPPQN